MVLVLQAHQRWFVTSQASILPKGISRAPSTQSASRYGASTISMIPMAREVTKEREKQESLEGEHGENVSG